MKPDADDDAGFPAIGWPSEGQLLADAVTTFLADSDGASPSRREGLIAGLRAAWSPNRLADLIGPDIALLRRLEYVRTVIVEHHGYRRLRGIPVGLADFDGEPVRIVSGAGIEVDRRAVEGIASEALRLAMLDAMLKVAIMRDAASVTTV